MKTQNKSYRAVNWRIALACALMGLMLAPAAQAALVGQWTFNEGSGTTALDSSGNGNNGTLNGGSYVATPGYRGVSLEPGDWVDMGAPALFDVTDEFSIEVWIRPGDGWTGTGNVFGKPGAYLFQIYNKVFGPFTTGGPDTLFAVPNPAVAQTNPASKNAGALQYEHWIASWGFGKIKVWVNGAQVIESSIGGDLPVPVVAAPLQVSSSGSPMKAIVDQVAIYDHFVGDGALIAAMYAAGPEIPEPSTVVLALLALGGLAWRRL